MNACEERAREAARNLANAVNEMSFDQAAFADELLRQHRSLQQNAFRSFLAVIGAWAKLAPNQCDLRNEYTVEKSREIVDLLGEYRLSPPHI